MRCNASVLVGRNMYVCERSSLLVDCIDIYGDVEGGYTDTWIEHRCQWMKIVSCNGRELDQKADVEVKLLISVYRLAQIRTTYIPSSHDKFGGFV